MYREGLSKKQIIIIAVVAVVLFVGILFLIGYKGKTVGGNEGQTSSTNANGDTNQTATKTTKRGVAAITPDFYDITEEREASMETFIMHEKKWNGRDFYYNECKKVAVETTLTLDEPPVLHLDERKVVDGATMYYFTFTYKVDGVEDTLKIEFDGTGCLFVHISEWTVYSEELYYNDSTDSIRLW